MILGEIEDIMKESITAGGTGGVERITMRLILKIVMSTETVLAAPCLEIKVNELELLHNKYCNIQFEWFFLIVR